MTSPEDGRRRVVIEGVSPEVDGGRFPVKRVVGDAIVVEADLFADGHDAVAAVVRYRTPSDDGWREAPMVPLVNDRWRGTFTAEELGRTRFTVAGWIDHFASWRRDLAKKAEFHQDVSVELQVGARLGREVAARARAEEDAARLEAWAEQLTDPARDLAARVLLALDEGIARLAAAHPDRGAATTYGRELEVVVDPPRARFSAWYELFPRSLAPEGRHGTFGDVEAHLDYVAGMGFDVLYLPPIHPIGTTFRKGKNNSPAAEAGDVGSPWAIGGPEGGHKAIHPELGTLEDFRRLVAAARDRGIAIALDIAFQCSPDHPYVREHPEWFKHRPDGSIQYAENPPKKYQDVYPFDFECAEWRALWEELKSVFEHWVAQGVRVFRVDNPHTKTLPFWEWCIGELKAAHPDLIFLSEAFTRPKVMYHLAKAGFTQSYTYFTWRNTRWQLVEYLTELTRTQAREFFRPNFWPNTPDILPEYLQAGGRPASAVRAVLAATLAASWGIYGPAFELVETTPLKGEEYLDSEKYQLRRRDLDAPHSLKDLIARINRIRRENPALQDTRNLEFHETDNEELLCFSKRTDDLSNIIVVVANLDPHHDQSGWVHLPLERLGITGDQPCQVHDLLGDERYLWHGARHFVKLSPQVLPAHVLRIRRRVRTEHDFDYFM